MRIPQLLTCSLLFFAFSAVLIGVAHADTETPKVKVSTRVSYTFPFTSLFYGAPIVQARINDTITATFLIDTGASTNAISQTLVDKLGLKPQVTSQITVPSLLADKQVTFVSLRRLSIGPLVLQGGAYIVLPAETLAAGMKQEVDGVISMQSLRYFAVDLDFSRHRITMWYPNGLPDDAVKAAGFGNTFAVALAPNTPAAVLYDPMKAANSVEAYWGLKYFVPVQISDGVHVSKSDLLLDTGSGVTVFPSAVSKILSLKVQGAIAVPEQIFGSDQANAVQAPGLQIGSLHLRDRTVGILQAKATAQKATSEMGTLGLDVLSGYQILIDFGAKRMYFKSSIPEIRIGAPQGKEP